MSEQLKPCPFCKCPAMFIGGGTRRFEKRPIHVGCSSRLCSARTSETLSKEQAAKIWNTRRWDEFDYQAASQQPATPDYKLAYNEWSDKTDWVRNTSWGAQYLGMHLADAMKARIQELEALLAVATLK